MCFDQKEGRFYIYNEAGGDWKRVQYDNIKRAVREDWFKLSKEFKRHDQLASKLTDATLNSIVNNIRSLVGAEEIFKRLQAIERYHGLLHVKNGMLTIRPDGSPDISGFSPDYYSRNPFDFEYDSKAECPKFKAVLEHAFDGDENEIGLFRRLCGGFLIQGNPAQKLPLLIGEASASKSMLMTIIERIVADHRGQIVRRLVSRDRRSLHGFLQSPRVGPLTFKTIERRLPETMHDQFGVHKSTHIERDHSRVNGYSGVALRKS